MSNQQPHPHEETTHSDASSQWSEPALIDGALCRQCKRCEKWFHIGWTAYHGCQLPRQYPLFETPA